MNVSDIITESHHACPHCGGPLVEYSDLMEKKDACYYKVKAGAKVWPSAYASGRLVQCRKKGAANWGNKSEGVAEGSGESYIIMRTDSEGKKDVFAGNFDTYERAQKELDACLAHPLHTKYKQKFEIKRKGQQGVAEAQLDEKCWDGYQQQGMKNKSGRQVPNCVPVEEELTMEQQFDLIEDMVESLAQAHGVDSEQIWEDFESVDDHELFETAAWRRSAGKSKKGVLNAKGVASYRRENPGSKLQMAVTTKPSKLKPGSKAAKRRKSFCARMSGVKGPMKKPNGKPTRKALALRKWNC